jgi:hypothetical protein
MISMSLFPLPLTPLCLAVFCPCCRPVVEEQLTRPHKVLELIKMDTIPPLFSKPNHTKPIENKTRKQP